MASGIFGAYSDELRGRLSFLDLLTLLSSFSSAKRGLLYI